MALTEKDRARADAKMVKLRSSTATAVAARYDRRISRIVILLNSGLEVAFSPRDAQGLEAARPADLDTIEISPSGLGIHFPKLDADLYLPPLLEGLLGSREWMTARSRSQSDKHAKTRAA
jgi:hypothetical protein